MRAACVALFWGVSSAVNAAPFIAVPEPSTLLLLGGALLVICLVGRRK